MEASTTWVSHTVELWTARFWRERQSAIRHRFCLTPFSCAQRPEFKSVGCCPLSASTLVPCRTIPHTQPSLMQAGECIHGISGNATSRPASAAPLPSSSGVSKIEQVADAKLTGLAPECQCNVKQAAQSEGAREGRGSSRASNPSLGSTTPRWPILHSNWLPCLEYLLGCVWAVSRVPGTLLLTGYAAYTGRAGRTSTGGRRPSMLLDPAGGEWLQLDATQ